MMSFDDRDLRTIHRAISAALVQAEQRANLAHRRGRSARKPSNAERQHRRDAEEFTRLYHRLEEARVPGNYGGDPNAAVYREPVTNCLAHLSSNKADQ